MLAVLTFSGEQPVKTLGLYAAVGGANTQIVFVIVSLLQPVLLVLLLVISFIE